MKTMKSRLIPIASGMALLAGLHTASAQDCAKLNPNARDSYGETPLTLAITQKKVDLVKAMLACKPDLSTKSGEGWYPLHTASYYGPPEVVLLMIKNGAAIDARGDYEGWTALHMAVQAGDKGIPMVQALMASGADKSLKSKSGQTAYDMAKGNKLDALLPLLKP